MKLKLKLKWYEKLFIWLNSAPGEYRKNCFKYWYENKVKKGGYRA